MADTSGHSKEYNKYSPASTSHIYLHITFMKLGILGAYHMKNHPYCGWVWAWIYIFECNISEYRHSHKELIFAYGILLQMALH